MKIINLPRGRGKTTRLLYASEFNYIPILCSTFKQKDLLAKRAYELGLKIPEPIVVSDIVNGTIKGSFIEDKDVLVDEAPAVLQSLLYNLGMKGSVKAISLTENDV